jgi:O-antigen/teichoic acid export membrane protein
MWSFGVHFSKQQLLELMSYARWPALSHGTILLQSHLGPFVLMALAGSAQAGLFSLGRYPAFVFNVVAVSLYQHWLPAASRMEGQRPLVNFLGRQMRLAGLTGLGMLLCAVGLWPLIPLLSEKFSAAASLFVLSALDYALLVLLKPVVAVYHGLYKPHIELLLRLSCLPLLLGTALALTSRFGAWGMAWAQVLSSLTGLSLGFWLLWRQLYSPVLFMKRKNKK